MSADYDAETVRMKDRYNELQTQMDDFSRQSRDDQKFDKLVEAYTDITEVIEELLHTLVDKIVVHEKEVVDGKNHYAGVYLLPLYR